MTQPEATSLTEMEYLDFLKTMLAEVLDDDDEIFTWVDRKALEAECLSLNMSLPLVRVVPDES